MCTAQVLEWLGLLPLELAQNNTRRHENDTGWRGNLKTVLWYILVRITSHLTQKACAHTRTCTRARARARTYTHTNSHTH